MLNNKGFAVTTVLYTLLIAFLMFLGAALAQFSSSSSLIGKANDDLINGTEFSVAQVRNYDEEKVCGTDFEWWQDSEGNPLDTIIRIKSRYGTKYWPRDFNGASFNGETETATAGDSSGNITVEYDETTKDPNNINYPGYDNYGKLIFKDSYLNVNKEIILTNICL